MYDAAKMTAGPRPQPSTALEEALWADRRRRVAGVDEVGRGPLAGPVYAAAVILDPDSRPAWLSEVRDSKELTANARQRLAEAIRGGALAVGVGWASVAEIDAWGIAPANRAAMRRALGRLGVPPDFLLIDGPATLDQPLPQRAIVDGDATCCSIAAASIVAKVARDAVMRRLDRLYPQYGFAAHKGYATASHLARLERYGACDQHRRSWPAVQRRVAQLRPELRPELAEGLRPEPASPGRSRRVERVGDAAR